MNRHHGYMTTYNLLKERSKNEKKGIDSKIDIKKGIDSELDETESKEKEDQEMELGNINTKIDNADNERVDKNNADKSKEINIVKPVNIDIDLE